MQSALTVILTLVVSGLTSVILVVLGMVNHQFRGFPDSSAGKESTCSTGDPGSIPGLGRSAGKGTGYPLQYSWASPLAQMVNNPPAMRETWVRSLGWEDLLVKGMGTHFSILTWRIPMDRAARRTTWGLQRVKHDTAQSSVPGSIFPISLRPVLGIVAAYVVDTVWSSCS